MPSKNANDEKAVETGMEPGVAPSKTADSNHLPEAAKVEVHGSGPRMAPPKPEGSRKPPGHRLPKKPE